jgi:hypothetical protein
LDVSLERVLVGVCRAQILAKKVSPRAFAERPDKKGQEAGEVGIEGTTIQAAEPVRPLSPTCKSHCRPIQFIISFAVGDNQPRSVFHVWEVQFMCINIEAADQILLLEHCTVSAWHEFGVV